MRRLMAGYTTACVALLVFSPSCLHASVVINFASHELDGSVRDYGHPWTDAIEMAAGRAGDLAGQPVPDNSGILFLELPSLASGQAVLDASQRVTLFVAQKWSLNENLHRYVFGYVKEWPREHNTDSSWYYSAALDTRTGDDLGTNIGSRSVFLLGDNFFTTSTPLDDAYTSNRRGISCSGDFCRRAGLCYIHCPGGFPGLWFQELGT